MLKKLFLPAAAFIVILELVLIAARDPRVLAKFFSNELESNEYVAAIMEASGAWDYTKERAFFEGKEVEIPEEIGPEAARADSRVLHAVAGDNKWIEIDLSDQRLYAHEGDRVVYSFLISSGKWYLTPTGEFRVWIKLRYHTMIGGSRLLGTYYNLPNVPYVMYFYRGFGIHGTYWHNNFGHPMSHGCVNMRTEDAEQLFYWAHPVYNPTRWATYPTPHDPGTRVVIHK